MLCVSVLMVVLSTSMCSIYGKILRDAMLQANKIQNMQSTTENNGTAIKRPGKKAIKMVLSILLCFMVSYLPFTLYCFLKLLHVDISSTNYSMRIMEFIGLVCVQCNYVVNVVIYAVFSQEFRRAYIKMLCLHKVNIVQIQDLAAQPTV